MEGLVFHYLKSAASEKIAKSYAKKLDLKVFFFFVFFFFFFFSSYGLIGRTFLCLT